MNNKVLFMRGYFLPETASDNQMIMEFITDLSENGFAVKVLCPLPTRGVDNNVRNKYKKKKQEIINDNLVIRRFFLPKESKKVTLRALRYFMQNVYQIGYALTHQYDVLFLYSTPPTNGFVGAMLRCMKKKPFVYYLHDVFPDSLISAGMVSQDSKIFKIGRKVEDFSYRHADKVIAVSKGIERNIREKGVPKDKTSVVYNWVDEHKITRIPREENTLIEEFNIDRNKFLVTYAGNIGEAQGVLTILETAELLREDSGIHFVIIGNGSQQQHCEAIVKERHLDNITMIPMQGIDRLSEVYSLGDVSLVLCKKGFGSSGMPSKMGSIMSASTAVLASFDMDSELADIIQKFNTGICVPPEDAEKVKDAIVYLRDKPELVKQFGKNGRKYLLHNMTRHVCVGALINEIHDVLSN